MSERGGRRFDAGRHAGVLVPLFSIPSRRSWGIGEIPDLVPLGAVARAAGFDFVQFLPLNEMQEGQSSPYSALSAMAIDPIFIAVDDVHGVGGGGENALSPRSGPRSRRADARRASTTARSRAEDRALAARVRLVCRLPVGHRRSPRPRRFARSWSASAGGSTTTRCSARCTTRTADATGASGTRAARSRSSRARRSTRRLDGAIRYYAYLQWIADEQWHGRGWKLRLSESSATFRSWSAATAPTSGRASTSSISTPRSGTPPDAFSATGQDWGLPAYRWDVVAAGDYEWLRARTRAARSSTTAFASIT